MQSTPTIKALTAILFSSLGFASSSHAQTLQRIEIDPAQPGTNTSISVLVHYTPGEPNFCGFSLDLGNGQTHSIRIGHEQDSSSPIRRTVVYTNPGNYTISAQGRFLSRGLRSAGACSGNPAPLAIAVRDLEAEKARQMEIEAQQKAQEALKQAEEQRRMIQERELELRRKELEIRERQLRQEEEQRRAAPPAPPPPRPTPRPAAPAPTPAPAQPSTPPPVRSVDGF